MKKDKKPIEAKPQTTIAYEQFRQYEREFLIPNRVYQALKQNRDFFEGRHYAGMDNMPTPKPVMNLCHEGVTKITAKLTGTKRYVNFLSSGKETDLTKLDQFYEAQMASIGDDQITDAVTSAGLIDGTAACLTVFDPGIPGDESLYKGSLVRKVIPFERCFFSDPYCADVQEQAYCGYYVDMDVKAARERVEGKDEAEIEAKKKLVCPENYLLNHTLDDLIEEKDAYTVRVYVRFFRVDGEVYFDMSTQYVQLTEYPHALNPKANEAKVKELADEFEKKEKGQSEAPNDETRVNDYAIDSQHYACYAKAVKQTREEWQKSRAKFWRYPLSLYSPLPTKRECVLGRSFVAMLIPNQKNVNYIYLLTVLIMQNHACPKIIVKPGALGNQVYDTSPNQIITDYSTLRENGGSYGITRLSSGDAVNSNLLVMADNIIERTRQIYGFANLDSSSTASDISGYAYSQMTEQANLPLEEPQRRLWAYIRDNAMTDLLIFRHNLDNAKFLVVNSDEDMDLSEDSRYMSQSLINRGAAGNIPELQPGTPLEPLRKVEERNLSSDFFDKDFVVRVEVEQGIAKSALSESQHFNQIMSYVAQGNIRNDVLGVMINSDPAISSKVRASVRKSIKHLETSQMNLLKSENDQLKQVLSNVNALTTYNQNVIKTLKALLSATEKAAQDQNAVAQTLLKDKDRQLKDLQAAPVNQMSESEVKSLNAKGISGGSFSRGGNETIYNQ